MCKATLFNIQLCPCKDITCPRVRPFERDAAYTGKFPSRSHIVTADEVVLPQGLPCATLFSLHGECLVARGGGDLAMADVAVRLCPALEPASLANGAVTVAAALCLECRDGCDQRAPTEGMIRTQLREKTEWDEARGRKQEAEMRRKQAAKERAENRTLGGGKR